ncbi:MAG: hypothetical protein JXQ76_05245 [Campylobacterales bacterium]|nr:hypothetical protein [Campylobacterales bacterium]
MNKSKLHCFMQLYLYQIETFLNTLPNELENIKFQSQEANTDEYVKKYFQDYLLKHNGLKSDFFIKELVYSEQSISIEKLYDFKVVDVLLPEQLNEEQKIKILESKSAVYTSPDLFLTITDGVNNYFETIELKSTKDNTVSGSSVQQILPYEWVIFLKRTSNKVIVTTGYYLHTITEKLPFPDRSPRPQIGFKTLQEWNENHRSVVNHQLIIEDTPQKDAIKLKILNDWQDYLASQWIEIVLTSKKNQKEKWFNNAIRKFTLKFIQYSNQLSKEEYERLERNLKKMIHSK